MKAIRVHSYGHSDRLELEETEEPQIEDDEVLVKIHAAGVNPIDWKIREGWLKDFMPQRFPFTPGKDVAGEIVKTGRKALNFKKGDQVYGVVPGAYAQYASAKPEWLARKPKSLDYDAAAAVPMAGLTAWLAVDAARLTAGQRVLIHGAAGGVGSFAVQMAHRVGARVAATAGGQDEAFLRSLGVEPVIDYHKERFEETMRGVDAVIDLVGGETLKRSYAIVRRGGHLVTTLGEVDEEEARRQGIEAVAIFTQTDWKQLEALAELIDQGKICPRLDRVLPLDQARQAQDLSQQGQTHGKIVLHVA